MQEGIRRHLQEVVQSIGVLHCDGSMYADDIKLAGKTENTEPTWKILMKDVDLGCTQRECKLSGEMVAN